MKKQSASLRAFSLIELSIVILVIGILIAGVTQGAALVNKMKLTTARTITESSPVASIKDLEFWVEATSEKSFDDAETAENSPISTWYDLNLQSNKYNATQSTVANKPKYVSKGINDLPAVSFDGVNDSLNLAAVIPGLANYTVILVEARSAATSGAMIGSSPSGAMLGYNGVDDTLLFLFHHSNEGVNDWSQYTIDAYTSPTPRIMSFLNRVNGSTGATSVYVNGALLGTAPRVLQGDGSYEIGHGLSAYYQGNIGEIIIFNRSLKTEERQSVERYLAKKWKITIS